MIIDQKNIEIKASPEKVFQQIKKNPFPTFKILDTRFFLFIRLALIDGIRTGWKEARANNVNQTSFEAIDVGSSLGPFTLIEIDEPRKYLLDLKSRFFNCQTGYVLSPTEKGTMLSFDVAVENLSLGEKIWWFFIKPIHVLLAYRVINNIQKESEDSE